MAVPVIPQQGNDWLADASMQGMFPPNVVESLPKDTQKEIVRFIHENYAWPQVLERAPYEPMWDTILDMYRIRMNKCELSVDESSPTARQQKIAANDEASTGSKVRVADSVVFDAVERCTCIHHFVSWKEGSPIQYNVPNYYDTRNQDNFYHPLKDKIKTANALLSWNIDNEDVLRKHEVSCREFYKYGVAFALSEFQFVYRLTQKMTKMGYPKQVPEIVKLGTSFDPISIRRLFLNYRLSVFDMDYQPCPFWFAETPRFATLQNKYDKNLNPFGFSNLDELAGTGQSISWLYTDPEMKSLREAIQGLISLPKYSEPNANSVPNLLKPEYSVDAIWTYYPMLPLDPSTLEWRFRQDGKTPVPFSRWIIQMYGQNLAGKQILLRCQRNFYPRDSIPLYGTSHMPDLDSGVYSPSLGYLLWNHYKEIVTCKNQYIANKDWVNNPPSTVLTGSPAANQDLTAPGAKIFVNGQQDIMWRTPYDATASTVGMITMLREQAKTSTKSDDAILGKALGGRTSATEANNAFQASMSAITTPINLFNYDIMGGFATRVWDYTGSWFPPKLLEKITGQMGYPLTPEDMWLRISLKWDVGSTYVESIVRQQNIRYILESSMGDPTINRAPMWRELLSLWRFDNAGEWVNDGGFEKQVYIATSQSIKTFNGDRVIINPDQDHKIAIAVKTRFIEDTESVFMTDPKFNRFAPFLVEQIQQHQLFLMTQMHLQLLQAKAMAAGAPIDNSAIGSGNPSGRQPPLAGGSTANTAGSLVQQGGVALA
jgi:hypothetical protein